MLFTEYQNQNTHRNYPFLDNATLTAGDARKLPSDFIIDAMLYPIDLENALYMSEVDMDNMTAKFADTKTGKVHGIADLSHDIMNPIYGTYSVEVREPELPYRLVGRIVLDDGRSRLSGVYNFEPPATELTPAAYYPLNQPGVRGIILEQGEHYHGHIKVFGDPGVTVTTYIDDKNRHIMRLDILGYAFYCDTGDDELVQCLKFTTRQDGLLAISRQGDNTIILSTRDFDLDDLCSPPNTDMPYEEPVDVGDGKGECGHISDDGLVTQPQQVCATGGRIYIYSPSVSGYSNPIFISAQEDPAPPADWHNITATQGKNTDELEDEMTRMFNPTSLSKGKITIGIRSIGSGRDYK